VSSAATAVIGALCLLGLAMLGGVSLCLLVFGSAFFVS